MQFIKPLSLAISMLLLSACASTTQMSSQPLGQSTQTPKQLLAKTMQQQLRSSFGYQTDLYFSNQIRLEALGHATKEQLDSADDQSQICQLQYEKAYMELAQTDDPSNDANLEGYENIKQALIDCQKSYDAHNYQNFDFESFYEQNQHLGEEDLAQIFMQQVQSHISNQNERSGQAYDTHHTALDAKKAKLLHEYLLKPMQLSMMGSYQPFNGSITALPMVVYQTKNLKLSLNQPIYVDLKAGGIYLWADNLALANSQFVDKRLGDKWRNKWLFIPLNDGSLPKDFTKDFVSAFIKAKKESFLSLPDSSFVQVPASELMALPFFQDNLPVQNQNLITQTTSIIKNQPNNQDKAYSDYLFFDTLYQTMVKKYPELENDDSIFFERQIVDGESVIDVVDVDDGSGQSADDGDKQTSLARQSINSLGIMRVLFRYFNYQVGSYYAQFGDNGEELFGEKLPAQTSKYGEVSYYGINQGKLAWLHQRSYADANTLNLLATTDFATVDEPIILDKFTRIYPNKKMNEFYRLPSEHQMPTPQNSIDVLKYKDELIEYLTSGEDVYLLTMAKLFSLDLDRASEDTPLIEEPDMPEEFEDSPIDP